MRPDSICQIRLLQGHANALGIIRMDGLHHRGAAFHDGPHQNPRDQTQGPPEAFHHQVHGHIRFTQLMGAIRWTPPTKKQHDWLDWWSSFKSKKNEGDKNSDVWPQDQVEIWFVNDSFFLQMVLVAT